MKIQDDEKTIHNDWLCISVEMDQNLINLAILLTFTN
jgi:hypothetical protein